MQLVMEAFATPQADYIVNELKEANLKHMRSSSLPRFMLNPQRYLFLRQHVSLLSMSRMVIAL